MESEHHPERVLGSVHWATNDNWTKECGVIEGTCSCQTWCAMAVPPLFRGEARVLLEARRKRERNGVYDS